MSQSRKKPYRGGKSKGYYKGGNENKGSRDNKMEMASQQTPPGMRSVRLPDYDSNDITFYNKYPEIFKDSTGLAWFQIQGAPVNWDRIMDYGDPTVYNNHKNQGLPGIMAIDFVPSPGIAGSQDDAANKAFQTIMADLYAKTTGSNLGFNAPALGMYLTSICSITNMIAYARKVLKAIDFWIPKNVNYPKAFIASCGFDYTELSKKQANYRSRLNSLIVKVNSMKIPKFVDLYPRQYALSEHVWTDEDDVFSQLYHFRPVGWYAFDQANDMCEYRGIDYDSFDSFEEYLDLIAEAIDKWYQNASYYDVNGALLRAYKGDAVSLFIPQLTESDMLDPKPDEYILHQIMNMDIVPVNLFKPESFNITEWKEKELLVWKPITPERFDTDPSWLLDFKVPSTKFLRTFRPSEKVDPDLVMEMTRFNVVLKEDKIPGTAVVSIDTMGTELISKVSIYTWDIGAQDVRSTYITSNFDIADVGDRDVHWYRYARNVINAFSPFRYIPRLFTYTSSNEVFKCGLLGDMSTYTYIEDLNLQTLNNCALISIWKPVEPNFG